MSSNASAVAPSRQVEPDQRIVVDGHAGLVQAFREALPTGRAITVIVNERRAERRRGERRRAPGVA
jgi:hypothetical protein